MAGVFCTAPGSPTAGTTIWPLSSQPIVSAVFFLAVVYVTGLNYRSQMLPR